MQTKTQSIDPKIRALLTSLIASDNRTLTLVTSYELSDHETKSIVEGLGLKAEEINIDQEIDKSILGGLIIKFNGYYLDLSLKTKLNQIVGNLN